MRVPRTLLSVAGVTAALFLVSACGGGGGGGGTSGENASEALVVMDINVADFDGVALNQILEIIFSEELDPDSVRPETIQIREGPDYGKQVPGDFRVDGDRVYFFPRLPTDDDLGDGGFHPGTSYRITVFGVPSVSVVRNYTQDRMLASEHVDYFQTALADDPDLFIDNFLDPGPPRVLSVNPANNARDVELKAVITLTFNRRPLNPASVNTDNFRLMMLERAGKIWNRPVPGGPVLNQALERVTVVFSPTFPLADQALYELTVSNRVEDLVGESVPAFSSRFTIKDEDYQPSKIRLSFTEQDKIDSMDESETTASWNGLVPNHLAALFTEAGGSGESGDLITNVDMEFTPFNTDGVETNVLEDGIRYDIFNFQKFEIAEGATVRFKSSRKENPVKIKALFPMKINGILTVSGGKGDPGVSYYYLSSGGVPRRPTYGGDAGPGGADGGDGYIGWLTSWPSPYPTNDGDDCPFGGYGGKGGKSGTYGGSTYYYSYAGGGGGGGSRLDGKPGDRSRYPTTGYWGKGGLGGSGRSGNLERRPNVGGAGGGPGGTGYYKYYLYTSWRQYSTGAGGGGGGGAVWLQCASSIIVGSSGQVLAEGGLGGDTASLGSYSRHGGTGGGGGGGSIKAVSTSGIQLETGAKLSVAGGEGGKWKFTYLPYKGAEGGQGGTGFLRFEVPQVSLVTGMTGADLTYTPVSIGTFSPQGGGVPSVGQTTWLNLGVFDPELTPHRPLTDVSADIGNDSMEIWVQMADEHPQKPGEPHLIDLNADGTSNNLDTVSDWHVIDALEALTGNGYQFIRVRVIFQLDSLHRFDDRLPRLEWLDIHFRY